jgi:hypothetical protein
MEATDWIAGYAAVVSTVAVGWQIRKEWRGQRPQVEVRIWMGVLVSPSGSRPGLQIEARNRADHPIRVASAGYNAQDDSGNVLAIMSDQPGATIPGVIQARDSGFTYLLPEQLRDMDPSRPVVGFVQLSTGERIHSKPTMLYKKG